jgi:hypothetical protein
VRPRICVVAQTKALLLLAVVVVVVVLLLLLFWLVHCFIFNVLQSVAGAVRLTFSLVAERSV